MRNVDKSDFYLSHLVMSDVQIDPTCTPRLTPNSFIGTLLIDWIKIESRKSARNTPITLTDGVSLTDPVPRDDRTDRLLRNLFPMTFDIQQPRGCAPMGRRALPRMYRIILQLRL